MTAQNVRHDFLASEIFEPTERPTDRRAISPYELFLLFSKYNNNKNRMSYMFSFSIRFDFFFLLPP